MAAALIICASAFTASGAKEDKCHIILNVCSQREDLVGWKVDSVVFDVAKKGVHNHAVCIPGRKARFNTGFMQYELLVNKGKYEKQKIHLDYYLSKGRQKQVINRVVDGFGIAPNPIHTIEDRIPAIGGEEAASTGTDWPTATPEEMGYSSVKLKALANTLKDEYTTTSMMVVVGGKCIFTYGDVTECVRIASCRKALISMLYSKYVEDGTIDLEATIGSLGIDDIGGLLPSEKEATVRDLITARSGVYHPAANDGDDRKYAPERGSVKHGTRYLYNNWDFNAAGAVFEKQTGKYIYDAFLEDIAKPVGMQDYRVDRQHKGAVAYPSESKYLAYHFWLSTRDMARIAYLMLHEGEWNGQQVISKDWVKTTTSIVTPRAEMFPEKRRSKEFDYGYLWWIFCKDFKDYDPAIYGGGYTATGVGGQYMTVLPALDMAIAHKDKTEKMAKSTYYKLIAKVAECRL